MRVQVRHLNLALYVFFSCFLFCLLKQGLSLNTQLTNSSQCSEPTYPGGSISAPLVLGFIPRQGVTPTPHSHGAGDLISGPYACMVRTLFARPPTQLMTDFHISILYPMILFQSLLNSTVVLLILSESLQRWSCHLQRHFYFFHHNQHGLCLIFPSYQINWYWSPMLNRNGEWACVCLHPDLGGKTSCFCYWEFLRFGFLSILFIKLKKFLFGFLRGYSKIMNRSWIFQRCFCIYWFGSVLFLGQLTKTMGTWIDSWMLKSPEYLE